MYTPNCVLRHNFQLELLLQLLLFTAMGIPSKLFLILVSYREEEVQLRFFGTLVTHGDRHAEMMHLREGLTFLQSVSLGLPPSIGLSNL